MRKAPVYQKVGRLGCNIIFQIFPFLSLVYRAEKEFWLGVLMLEVWALNFVRPIQRLYLYYHVEMFRFLHPRSSRSYCILESRLAVFRTRRLIETALSFVNEKIPAVL